jgi:hypothetical protein
MNNSLQFDQLVDLFRLTDQETAHCAYRKKIEHFLLDLGKGFLFEARQKRIIVNNDNGYIDLVFYHRFSHRYILINLKNNKATLQDLTQMQRYIHYFDDHVKTDNELPTLGFVLSSQTALKPQIKTIETELDAGGI